MQIRWAPGLVTNYAWLPTQRSRLRQQISYMNTAQDRTPATGVKAEDQEFLKAIIPTRTSIRSHRLRRLVS
jgi:hypothetical protein